MEKLLKNPYTALCHGYHTRVHRKIRKPKQSFGRLYFAMRRRDLKAAGAKPTAVAVVAEAGSWKFCFDENKIIPDQIPPPQWFLPYLN